MTLNVLGQFGQGSKEGVAVFALALQDVDLDTYFGAGSPIAFSASRAAAATSWSSPFASFRSAGAASLAAGPIPAVVNTVSCLIPAFLWRCDTK